MKTPTPSLKPFEALGTALTDKYRYNPYVRSTINIVALQVVLTILLVLAFGFALRYQQEETLAAISLAIDAAMQQQATSTPALETSLDKVRSDTLQFTLFSLVLLTACFGFLTARYALKPTKNSLQFQKRFIGNMAHEIRTPLSIIKTNTEVALMDPHLSPDIRETLNTTSQELDRISETINNLLSFNTMIRPSHISLTTIDLAEAAAAVVHRHLALAESRGIDLTFDTDGSHLILGNATGIDQVFTNLIKNALNYTPKHADGSVTVVLRGDDRHVTASITDTGIGIAKKDLYYIFQPFYRADTSRARGVGGGTSGLGLAIVNEIVRTHGGRITVRSALNRGTTIEVIFPKVGADGKNLEEEEEIEKVDLKLS